MPRVIWMLWFDGWSKAPELHQRCRESWELFNPGWEVRPIARSDLPGLLGDFLPRYERLRTAMNPLEKFGGFWIPPAAESDLLRLILLGLYGGVWADSTMLCRRPLDDWLPEAAASGFFAFAPEDVEQQLPVMSSFLASAPAHKLVSLWLKYTVEHWSLTSDRRPDLGFFWVHKLFGQLVGDPLVSGTGGKVDEEAKRLWAAVPRVSGEYGVRGPHFWVKYSDTLKAVPTPQQRAVIEGDSETPMWKLTNHEVKLTDVGPESCYWVLLEESRRQALAHELRALAAGGAREAPALRLAVLRKLLAPGDAAGCH